MSTREWLTFMILLWAAGDWTSGTIVDEVIIPKTLKPGPSGRNGIERSLAWFSKPELNDRKVTSLPRQFLGSDWVSGKQCVCALRRQGCTSLGGAGIARRRRRSGSHALMCGSSNALEQPRMPRLNAIAQ